MLQYQRTIINTTLSIIWQLIDSGMWYWLPDSATRKCVKLEYELSELSNNSVISSVEQSAYLRLSSTIYRLFASVLQCMNQCFADQKKQFPELQQLGQSFSDSYAFLIKPISITPPMESIANFSISFARMFDKLIKIQQESCAHFVDAKQVERYVRAKYLSNAEDILRIWRQLCILRRMYQNLDTKSNKDFMGLLLNFLSLGLINVKNNIPQQGAKIGEIRVASAEFNYTKEDCAELILLDALGVDINRLLKKKLHSIRSLNRSFRRLRWIFDEILPKAFNQVKIIRIMQAWHDFLLSIDKIDSLNISQIGRRSWLWETKKQFYLQCNAHNVSVWRQIGELLHLVDHSDSSRWTIFHVMHLLQIKKQALQKRNALLENDFVVDNTRTVNNIEVSLSYLVHDYALTLLQQVDLIKLGKIIALESCATARNIMQNLCRHDAVFVIDRSRSSIQLFFCIATLLGAVGISFHYPFLLSTLAFATTAPFFANIDYIFAIGKRSPFDEIEILNRLPLLTTAYAAISSAALLKMAGIKVVNAMTIAFGASILNLSIKSIIAKLPATYLPRSSLSAIAASFSAPLLFWLTTSNINNQPLVATNAKIEMPLMLTAENWQSSIKS